MMDIKAPRRDISKLMDVTTAKTQEEAIRRAIQLYIHLGNGDAVLLRNGIIDDPEVDPRWG